MTPWDSYHAKWLNYEGVGGSGYQDLIYCSDRAFRRSNWPIDPFISQLDEVDVLVEPEDAVVPDVKPSVLWNGLKLPGHHIGQSLQVSKQ